MLNRNIKLALSIMLVAVFLALPLSGCSSGGAEASSSSSQSATSADGEFGLKSFQFHDITVMVPDTLYGEDHGYADQVTLVLSEGAKDPFAFNMSILVNEGVNYTARSVYELKKDLGGNTELVEANGLEFLVEKEIRENINSVHVTLALNGSAYRIFVDYKQGLDPAYARYANDVCQYINPAGASSSQESSIPVGAISWQEAQSHIGENVTVYGPVVKTNYVSTANGLPTYLDIGVAYPDKSGVSALIWGEDRANFSSAPESTYDGKTICVTGEPYMYNGQCYIKVTSPDQIQVL